FKTRIKEIQFPTDLKFPCGFWAKFSIPHLGGPLKSYGRENRKLIGSYKKVSTGCGCSIIGQGRENRGIVTCLSVRTSKFPVVYPLAIPEFSKHKAQPGAIGLEGIVLLRERGRPVISEGPIDKDHIAVSKTSIHQN